MKIFKNRVLVAAICMVMAGLIAFVGVPIYNNLSLTRMDVVRAKQDISIGTKITADMVETVEVGKLNLPTNTILMPQDAVGKFAITDIQKTDTLTASKIAKTLTLPNVKVRSLKANEQAITIAPHSEASNFAFRLLPNDIISIYEVKNGKATLVPQLTYVSVVVETTSNGIQLLKENQTDSDGNVLKPSTMTFILNPVQTQRMIELNNASSFYIALKYRGNDDTIRQKYIDAQNEYFNGGGTVADVTEPNASSSSASSTTSTASSKSAT